MKKAKTLLALLLAVVCVAGCSSSTSFSYTFKVGTGDEIKVKLDTSDGYSLSQEDGQFYIKDGEETLVTGIFTTEEYWDYYTESIPVVEGAEVIKEDELCGGNDGLVYTYEEETNAILHVKDSNTYVMLASVADTDVALDVMENLEFTKE